MSSSRPNSKYYGHERVPSSSRSRVTSNSNPTRDQASHSNSHSHSRSQSTGKPADRRIERNNVLTRESITVKRAPGKNTESRSQSRKSRDDVRQGKPSAASTPTSAEPKKEEREPWRPQASLIPHTTAPLASRISTPQAASLAPVDLQPQPLSELPVDEQESALIDDLMFVFMGFEGQYIRYVATYNPSEEKSRLVGPSFRIAPGLDPSLRDLTTSMLKMATHYSALEAFVEVQSRDEYGSVNHALCAVVRKLLRDYLVLMAQLEHQMLTSPTFTLHILNLHTKPTSHMMFQLYTVGIEVLKANALLDDENDDDLDETENLEDILESLREGGNIAQGSIGSKKVCKGGSVLGLISKRLASMSGDPAARALLTALLREASRPYMTMLNEWLHHGSIKDPHAEFLIKEQKSIKRERLDQDYTDEYWEKRYTIRESLVPPQLEGVKDKVLLAGKYLNVVRECGGVDVSKRVQDVPITFDDPRFLENVNSAYAYANSSLLHLLLTTHALPARLRSLKHYFFLDRSDFFSYFLELGTSELKKPAKIVNIGKLQSLLDIVLRQPGSVAAEDPYKEDVKVQMNEIGLTNWLMKIVTVTGLDQDAATGSFSNYVPTAQSTTITDDKDITGFDALVLDYAMPFPLSLVVSRVTLTRYQLLFRYLLSLRHLETLLVGSWSEHTKVRSWKHRSSNPKIEMWKRKAFTLRARMLVFVQQLLYYSTAEVIEPNWSSMMSRLNAVSKGDAAENAEVVQSTESIDPTATAAVADGSGDPLGGPQVKRTVDELMQDHVDFLATCLKECMLTNAKLLKINSKILNTCTMFANYTSSLSRYLISADADLATAGSNNPSASTGSTGDKGSSARSSTFDPSKLGKMIDLLQKYEDNFTKHLRILLDTLNYYAATETVVFLSLCARLSAASEGLGLGVNAKGETVY
ncbi:spindle pole body component alp4 [Diplodia corticola]|uniref:Spindle pole body component n=1 Tax=Diplodia corticola TaxID=236234 RepID=A0A1J9QST0_9PEZI|nr:spindle pole body component alp4 [Diplodia corticola]OJD31504.1 spindle pole body component alp4 [Diplodia corticola]